MQPRSPTKAHTPARLLKRNLIQAVEQALISPAKKQNSELRPAEFHLLQMAAQIREAWPNIDARLTSSGNFPRYNEEAAILDLYLLVLFWSYMHSGAYLLQDDLGEMDFSVQIIAQLNPSRFGTYVTESIRAAYKS
jgi:hypothetical protein